MRSLYIASTEGSGGKTTLSVGLCLALRARGLDVGYFKPVGTMPRQSSSGERVDDDAAFVADVLGLTEPLTDLCPVVLDEGALHEVLAGADGDTLGRVQAAFDRVRKGRDLVVCEGLGEIWQGRFLRASGADVVAKLDLGAVLVARFAGARLLDDICYVKDGLKQRLLGVIFNMVPEARIELVRGEYTRFLDEQDIATYGVLPANRRLAAITVGEIVEALGATYICGEEHADALAETYLIGAMSPEHALRYFQNAANKVVVVGGDRAEIILAALDTPTAAIVLTGSYVPSPTVLNRAQELGVPVVSVPSDTVAATDAIQRLFGRLGVHDARKIELISDEITRSLDLDRLIGDLQR
ncbi:MAG TPA: phosphotransacetylase family protein [Thermoleophilia bacterium]|nr:phosphotransacetylase family protein [Thermoleophilia bacterium]